MRESDWYGLYRERWGDELVSDAYSHPAKFARGLIRRIYAHLFEHGYLRPGDAVVDPFGGVALGGLDAMRLGCHWIGGELEAKFVDLGNQNIDRWNDRYRGLWPDTWGTAVLLQGDSRELGRVLRGHWDAEAVVSSPPYSGNEKHDYGVEERDKRRLGKSFTGRGRGSFRGSEQYSTDPANLGNMRASDQGLEAVVSSPPYAAGCAHTGGETSPTTGQGGPIRFVEYGATDGQLAAMPEGDLDAVVSSPPYVTNTVHGNDGIDKGQLTGNTPGKHSQVHTMADYGASPGQLAQETTDDFWTAARAIVDQCHAILKPGAVAVWVVKRFVRNKQIVDFPGQWEQMCEVAGFETVEHVRAWLVEDRGVQIDLFGNDHQQTVARKSFFRRLYESKYPENSIDWEDVIIMRRRP